MPPCGNELKSDLNSEFMAAKRRTVFCIRILNLLEAKPCVSINKYKGVKEV